MVNPEEFRAKVNATLFQQYNLEFLVKVKNSIYIEFHLGGHKYYDKVRKDLDIKKGNY